MSEHESAQMQAKEKMLEALFEYATACHIENIIAENSLENDSFPDLVLPPEFNLKMKRLIAKHDRKEKYNQIKKETVKLLPKVAIFLLALFGSFMIIVTSVQALRVKTLNMILNVRNQYTSIQETDENNPKQTVGQIPLDWSGYLPSFIPYGYKVVKTEESDMSNVVYYLNEQGQSIRFSQYLSGDTDLRIDTEDAIVENISLNNADALLAEKQGLVSIVWKKEFLFSLIGEADRAEMIKMAESIH